MYRTYAEYRVALDQGHLAEAMRLEALYLRMEEKATRWWIIRVTFFWAAAAFVPVHLLTQLVP